MAANSNISSIGRFSSQMLTYLGTQRTVKSVQGAVANTFKYANGPTSFVDAGSLAQSEFGMGVSGSYSPASYNYAKSYFLARGVGPLYADTMVALSIDMATMLGVSVQSLLEQVTPDGKLLFSADAYRSLNVLRDPGNQVGVVTSVNNRFSLQAREIRS